MDRNDRELAAGQFDTTRPPADPPPPVKGARKLTTSEAREHARIPGRNVRSYTNAAPENAAENGGSGRNVGQFLDQLAGLVIAGNSPAADLVRQLRDLKRAASQHATEAAGLTEFAALVAEDNTGPAAARDIARELCDRYGYDYGTEPE